MEKFIVEILQNKILIISIFSLVLAQVLKVFTYFLVFKDWNLTRAFGSGGMPSSHSSFVTSLAVLVGLENGFDSVYFAIAAVGAGIVMYDASGVRMAVGNQARVLNELQRLISVIVSEDMKIDEKLKELIGHTRLEVFMGLVLGIVVALVGYKRFF